MCERLALTTRDLLLTHSRLYDTQYRQDYYTEPTVPSVSAVSPSSQASTQNAPVAETLTSINNAILAAITEPEAAEPPFALVKDPVAQQHSALPLLQESFPFTTSSGEIDFNSSEFLYDSALFGQIMFDVAKPSSPTGAPMFMEEQPIFPTDVLGSKSSSTSATSPTDPISTTLGGLVGSKPLLDQSP